MSKSEITAYFDASGNSGSSAITMAGFVSRTKKWVRFEDEWKAILPSGIRMFHMTDFASSKNGWESWRGKPERGIVFDKLIACIKQHTNKGFGVSVRLSDYRDLDARYQLDEAAGGAYALVGCACLAELEKWAARHGIDYRTILCVFEDGDAGQGFLIDRARADGYKAIPQSKAAIRAFDACDLVGWKTRTLVDDALVKQLHNQDPIAAQRVFKTIDQLNPILHLNGVIDRATLEALRKAVNLQPRCVPLIDPSSRRRNGQRKA